MLRTLVRKALAQLGLEIRRKKCRKFQDPFEVQRSLLQSLDCSDPVIFDLGANRGQTALRYRALFPRARIFSYEPFEDSFRQLESVTGADPNTTVLKCAVSDTTGTENFFINHYDVTNSLLARPAHARRYYPSFAGPKRVVQVEVTTLDAAVREHELSRIDLLKMDIQGGELKALRGARLLLEKQPPPLIYSEVMFVPHYEQGPLLHDIWTFLSVYGYSLYSMYDLRVARNGQLRYGDALFVNDKMRREVLDAAAAEP